jgi:hypothetical protein
VKPRRIWFGIIGVTFSVFSFSSRWSDFRILLSMNFNSAQVFHLFVSSEYHSTLVFSCGSADVQRKKGEKLDAVRQGQMQEE